MQGTPLDDPLQSLGFVALLLNTNLRQTLGQKLEVALAQGRRFIGQVMSRLGQAQYLRRGKFILQHLKVVLPGHGHIRLTLNDQRAACTAWRRFDMRHPLAERANPGGRQVAWLQRVLVMDEVDKLGIAGIDAETPGISLTKRFMMR